MHEQLDHFKHDADGQAYAGDHLLVELWGASGLDDAALIETTLSAAAAGAGATELHSYYHRFGDGGGISGVVVLAESHISIHTWPERAYAAIDVFMCGDCDPLLTVPVLEASFRPQSVQTQLIQRGVVTSEAKRSVA